MVAPPGKKFGRFTRPLVRFGKPLDFSRYEGMENDRYILRSVTDEIMYEIMRLSGQEYVDIYASRAKELAAKAKDDAKKAEKEAAERAQRRARRPTRSSRAQEGVLTGSRFASYDDPAAQAVQDRLFRALAVPAGGAAGQHGRTQRAAPGQLRAPDRGRAALLGLAAWTAFAIWAYADGPTAGRRSSWRTWPWRCSAWR